MDATVSLKQHWTLDPGVVFLNHGSFGACPRTVLARQAELRERLERQPVQFLVRDLEALLDESRAALAAFLNAPPGDLAWVPNATTGVNAVLRSLKFGVGDELLVTNHEYNACRNALDHVAARDGARVVVADIPFPIDGPGVVTDAVMAAVTGRTRLALLDHVTSQTGLILPLEEIVPQLAARGVHTLIDGAHAPGMIDVDLERLDADFYSGNCHKWLCAPKVSGFLYVRRELQRDIRPVVISHGANTVRSDRSRFLMEFDWPGTWDPASAICVAHALTTMEGLAEGGWPAVKAANHELVVAGRRLICDALGIAAPCPESMLGSLASVPLPDATGEPPKSALYTYPIQESLLQRWNIEVPVAPWPAHPRRLLRISAQLYNEIGDYQRLAGALRELFPAAA